MGELSASTGIINRICRKPILSELEDKLSLYILDSLGLRAEI
jgi:hypothetical protein